MAADYDPFLLRVQASIYPKIIMLDEELEKKKVGNEIVLNIMTAREDVLVAENLRGLIVEKYKTGLGGRELKVIVTEFEKLNLKTMSTAYILLRGSSEAHANVIRHASNMGRIVFSYSYNDFENNILISLHVKEKTYIYLNKSALHQYDIKFLPVFYKIATILE
ncbi:MAG: hypothetical protein OQK73_04270 [Gammaproteobacteria bacterium]|nr:hypothetical protein [Gammaproteobacteria bacterium]